jgi:basic membrane protein A and related proteins
MTSARRWLVMAWAAVSACGGTAERPDSAAAVDAAAFKVALLTPGPISDQSWNGGAYQGLMRIRDSLGAQVSHVQTKTPADFEENFREYGARGFDLVFGHGFEFQDAAKRVAPQFPRTVYVTTSGNTASANVAGILFSFADASYLAGMLAGSMTKSGVLGVIGGTELPPVKESFAAFERGVRSVRPGARVLSAYVGNWDDVSAGKEQALAQIARGVDVIFQNADAAGLGVFQAARDRRGVFVIGSNADQNGVAPEVTLGSVVIDLPRAFLEVAREVKGGSFRPRVVTFDARSDVVRLVVNPALAARIPGAVTALIDSVNARIHAGTFTASPP